MNHLRLPGLSRLLATNLSTGALQRTAWQSGRQPWKSHLLEPIKKNTSDETQCIQNIKTGKILEKSNLKHPRKLTWNPKIGGFGSMFLLFQGCIFRFHVSFRGGYMTLSFDSRKKSHWLFCFVGGVFGGWNSSKAKVEMASRYLAVSPKNASVF